MIAARRAVFDAGAAALGLSFIRWRGQDYLRIETSQGVLFHDGKNLLRSKEAAALSPADSFAQDALPPADVEERHPLPRDPGIPHNPDQPTLSEIALEPEVAHPEDEDPSPGW